jgi:hypothetical protein
MNLLNREYQRLSCNPDSYKPGYPIVVNNRLPRLLLSGQDLVLVGRCLFTFHFIWLAIKDKDCVSRAYGVIQWRYFSARHIIL